MHCCVPCGARPRHAREGGGIHGRGGPQIPVYVPGQPCSGRCQFPSFFCLTHTPMPHWRDVLDGRKGACKPNKCTVKRHHIQTLARKRYLCVYTAKIWSVLGCPAGAMALPLLDWCAKLLFRSIKLLLYGGALLLSSSCQRPSK